MCRGKLAVNLGITYGKLYGFDEAALEESVIRAMQELVRSGWDVTLVSAWGPDDKVMDRICGRVHIANVERRHDDYQKAPDSVDKFDIVLAEKLHVVVVAACRGVPFVAVNYRSKVRDFCRSIDWDEFCLEVERLSHDAILERGGIINPRWRQICQLPP